MPPAALTSVRPRSAASRCRNYCGRCILVAGRRRTRPSVGVGEQGLEECLGIALGPFLITSKCKCGPLELPVVPRLRSADPE